MKIAVADDHPLMLNGICNLLSSQKDMEITGRYATGDALLEGIESDQPDILLLDITLPDRTGNELVRILSKKYPQLRIIALTSLDTPFQIRDMMGHGCSGYLLKSTAPEILIEAIKEVHNGGQFVEPSLKEQMLNVVFQQTKSPELTKREQEILALICAGEKNNEIAKKLYLSLRTIENHRFSLYQKFGVKNSAALVKVALEQGLV